MLILILVLPGCWRRCYSRAASILLCSRLHWVHPTGRLERHTHRLCLRGLRGGSDGGDVECCTIG